VHAGLAALGFSRGSLDGQNGQMEEFYLCIYKTNA
jgi:hypothetical protein